ncbi:MAG: hypothetical protein MR377_03520 [Lactobacillus johnsonii]|nr:hypothetical protein [Lactobacillus johnsonii]
MNGKKVINQILLERGKDLNYLADALGIKTQSLRNKLNRDNYGLNDFVEMLDIMECDIKVVTRDTNKVFN